MTARETPTADSKLDRGLLTYNSPEVAQCYAAMNYLTPCEQLLFDAYLKPGMAILDLGVGGGRTTPYLSSIAGRYVGVDYASEMIAACRKKFPQLEFETANVADMSNFSSQGFDAAVMAFNGMDSMIPDESRFRALREIGRVLKPEGILIFPPTIHGRSGCGHRGIRNVCEIWRRPLWRTTRFSFDRCYGL